jgi:UDP-N-acetylmuramate--alanine ligase
MDYRQRKIFFSGIAGSGVSALAVFMADKGHIVFGSDRAFDRNPHHPLKIAFESRGITIVPQDGTAINNTFDLAVFSTAVEPDRPEYKKVRASGVPVKTRPDFLNELATSYQTIAVSGTSGKSTAAGLLTFLMNRLGLKPNFIGGGRVKQFKSPANPGSSLIGESDYLVMEACESDGSIINYRPKHSIILNLALDHHPVEQTSIMFRTLMEKTEEEVFINGDDDNLRSLRGGQTITFSIQNPSPYQAESINFKPFSTDFTLHRRRFSLSLPGVYNLYNALSCIAFLSERGIQLDEIKPVLPEFQGIDRRFDIHLNDGERLVIDDYAHNPHKISSLMSAVKRIRKEICYIFQPHGFGPTRMMKKEYMETFIDYLRTSDHLILLPIFYAGGTASRDISSHDLAEGIKVRGKSVSVVSKGLYKYKTYVIFGARDDTLSDLARDVASALSGEGLKRSL